MCAVHPEVGETIEALIRSADSELYRLKPARADSGVWVRRRF